MAPKVNPPRQWLVGRHAVRETLKAKPGSVVKLLVQRGQTDADMQSLVQEARAAGARVEFVDRREIDRRSPRGRHQGLALEVESVAPEGLKEFLGKLSPEKKNQAVVVALDEIQDPQNLGAIARSAANFGAGAIIICQRRSAPVTDAAVRASAGAIQRIPVLSVASLGQALRVLKENGFWIYGADMEGESLWSAALNRPLVLVIGSEGHGLREPVKNACDGLLKIPQSELGVESLNASAAAGILLYEAARRLAPR